jgi:hypothetical protein
MAVETASPWVVLVIFLVSVLVASMAVWYESSTRTWHRLLDLPLFMVAMFMCIVFDKNIYRWLGNEMWELQQDGDYRDLNSFTNIAYVSNDLRNLPNDYIGEVMSTPVSARKVRHRRYNQTFRTRILPAMLMLPIGAFIWNLGLFNAIT